MSDPSYELQDALHDALKNNIGPEVGPRIYDNVPTNATFPYVTIGDGQVLADKAGCIDGTEHFVQIDVWSRAVGYPEAKTISNNILAVIDDKPPPMDGYVAVIFELENIQYLRDPDGLTRHVAMTFHSRIQPYDAPPVTSAIAAAAGSGSASASGSASVVPATLNPSDKESHITVSGGNLTAAGTAGWQGIVRGIAAKTSGKFYFEVTFNAAATSSGVGLALGSLPTSTTFNGSVTTGHCGVIRLGSIYHNGSQTLTVGGTPSVLISFGTIASGTVIGVAVDMDAKLFWLRLGAGGNWNNNASRDPATGAGGIDISDVTTAYPTLQLGGADTLIANFGASAFVGAVPAGFTPGWPI